MATKGIQVELLLNGITDTGDVALAGGKVYTYGAGTLTNKTTWTDRDKTTPATNPVVLDSAGKALIFADGVYKFVIKDANDVTIYTYDNLEFGQTFTGIFNLSKGADIASANALTLGSDGNYFDITGTTTINSIGAVGVGTVIKLHFDAALTLTYNATDLILPGAKNITTSSGDEAEFIEYATGDWICTKYQKANGNPVINSIVRQLKGADVASAGSLTLGTDGNYFDITGTTAITSIGSIGIGTVVTLHFDAALTLTHHATDLVLPGAANIKTAPGDEATFIQYAAGDWRCIGYTKASGLPVDVFSKGSDIVSEAALFTTAGFPTDGNYFDVTGTTAITSIITSSRLGTIVKIHFDAILTLTHHATDLILPSGANITTAAGDEAEFVEYASGDWRCTNYSKASGQSVAASLGDYIHIQRQQPSGTNDITSSSTSWNKRSFTDILDDTGGRASLSSGVITLEAGTYRFIAMVTTQGAVNISKSRLQNTSDATTVEEGLNGNKSDASAGPQYVSGRFTIAASKDLEIQTYTQSIASLGTATSVGAYEVYADIQLWVE